MPVTAHLEHWRSTQRRLDQLAVDDPTYPAAVAECLRACIDYQRAAGLIAVDDVVLIADGDRRYIVASENATAVLGRDPVGTRIDDLSAADATGSDGLDAAWSDFLESGTMDGDYRLATADGAELHVRFHALAHVPLPGYHVSRLTPLTDEALSA
jgi:PAS domain-containing protein